MSYPEGIGLRYHDYGPIRIVEIADLLPKSSKKSYKTRNEWAIRKILIHHHAGSAKSTADKLDNGVPKSCKATADFFVNEDSPAKAGIQGRGWPGYAYHYDIGYGEDRAAGKDLVYQTQHPNRISYHTGAGQNEMGISISHMGSMRHIGAPRGASYSPDEGRPHESQKRALPALTDYLQEKYGISDLHVQGHFQHRKPACPGWDIEFWIMQREERPRREGRAFCWPIAPGKKDEATFLTTSGQDAVVARDLMRSNLRGGSGFFPFGRRFLWHDGVHLFPVSGAGANVYAVRDGWVVGARLNKNVVLDGRDYGSASFVLVLHEDPGLYDPLDSRTHGSRRRPEPIRYYSLYMHLAPLDESIAWVARLKERDRERYDEMTAAPHVGFNVAGVSIPVKAGEVIGKVGVYNPFAARSPNLKVADDRVFDASSKPALHFEMFFRDHLVKRFDPDRELHKTITIRDSDRDAIADNIVQKLSKLSGFGDEMVDHLKSAVEAANEIDPGYEDPSAWTVNLSSKLNDALSRLIVEHRSEWGVSWKSVINANYRRWGLDKNERDHYQRVVREFQWWNEVVKSQGIHRAKLTGLSANARPFYAHPVRFLCWLNGLRRVLDREPTGGIDEAGYPISTNIDADLWIRTSIVAKASAGETTIRINGSVGEDRLKGGSLRIQGHTQVYVIRSFEVCKKGSKRASFDLVIAPSLREDVKAGTAIKLGNYGWHYEQTFAWNTDLS